MAISQTDLDNALEKASLYEKRYTRLVNSLYPDFIFIFDKDFIFKDIILPEGLRLFHSNEEIIGTSGRDLYSPEVSDLIVTNIKECLKCKKIREIEYHLDLFGNRYFYQARLVPIEDDQVLFLIRDIGDRVRRMEELLNARKRAEESDKLKSTFLANMSHEIRTPLNAIIGFTEIIASEDDPDLKEEYLRIVRSNNDLLLKLINDILDLSKIESGKTEMHFELTNINDLIEEVRQTQLLKMKEGLELVVNIPKEPIQVYTDPNRVKQILFNFLSNAVKNTESGSVTVDVEILDTNIKFSVTDTGRGIAQDKIEAIFRRFEKLDDFVQGTGLGLPISQGLVLRLGGKIDLKSEIGVGSTFSFTLPYSKDVKPVGDNVTIGNIRELYGNQKQKIVVAEQVDEDYTVLQEMLADKYDLIRATDGEQITDLFITENPDLLLINIHLEGEIRGIDAIKKIRSISSSIPIIGITTNDFYVEQRWAMDSGCNDIISKPYSQIQLEEVILAFI